MEDPRLRAEFHRAFDAVVPPAPWLAGSVRQGLRERGPAVPTRPALRTNWLAPAVALLLAIAIVATLIYVARSQAQRTIPVLPPRQGQGPDGCPQWITANSGGGSGQSSATMANASTGWFNGALRTTDGGTHWRDVSPPAMRADAPRGSGERPYPPGYVEFFLDSTHAWVARTYGSAATCFDHVSVFATSDGGLTWDESAPVIAAVQADTTMQMQLSFVDPLHGWLLMNAGGRLVADYFLYSSMDGGRHWKQDSQLKDLPPCSGLAFIPQTPGYLSCKSYASTPTLNVTRDGGKTWNSMRLPISAGSGYSVQSSVFFDQDRGVLWLSAQIYEGNSPRSSNFLIATTDGGRTWQQAGDFPQGYPMAVAFLDTNNFWALISEGKVAPALYQTNDGGKSWAVLTRDLPPWQFGSSRLLFIDQRTGFMFGPSQQLGQAPSTWLVTSDGGRMWKEVHPQVS